jgi:hypothetical protein
MDFSQAEARALSYIGAICQHRGMTGHAFFPGSIAPRRASARAAKTAPARQLPQHSRP